MEKNSMKKSVFRSIIHIVEILRGSSETIPQVLYILLCLLKRVSYLWRGVWVPIRMKSDLSVPKIMILRSYGVRAYEGKALLRCRKLCDRGRGWWSRIICSADEIRAHV